MEESWASSPAARNTMRANPGRDTRPELQVRRLLHGRGLRYRVNLAPVPGLRRTADVVFPRERIAIFIDGCFWHGCPVHYIAPKANSAFWSDKVSRNRGRDLETNARFTEAGWNVLRYWEHEAPEAVAAAIEVAVKSSRRASHGRV
ncbi:very short patch repair endonuclease [Agromyces sp. ZXT2-3]|uniref:very short patch repair endonuclease n=1 Tax=Agromyces sp. ZXT2-3 TaxID=3461152 RepID=UPI00405501E2